MAGPPGPLELAGRRARALELAARRVRALELAERRVRALELAGTVAGALVSTSVPELKPVPTGLKCHLLKLPVGKTSSAQN